MDCLELLSALIEIPSVSREEAGVADFLETYLAPFEPHRVAHNIYLTQPCHDERKPTLLLNAHLDTVKPVSGWTRDPFRASLEGDRLYGLGSNDCGGGLVTLLSTFLSLRDESLPYNLLFAASSEEEVSGKNGMELLLRSLPRVDVALVGEPTSMKMAVAEKGLMVLDCVSHGVSGHAARNEGRNAIYEAMDDIAWFRSHAWGRPSRWLGDVKTSVTMISSGIQHNVVPDECRFVVDVRTTDTWGNEETLAEIRAHVSCDVTPRSTRLNSSGISSSHPLVRAASAMGIELFGSPTLSDQALMRFASVKLGPGDSARSHTADEYILVSEMERALETYGALLRRLDTLTDLSA